MKKVSPSVQVSIAALLLALITIWVFWPSLDFDFVNFDDNEYIYENPLILQGLSWRSVQQAFRPYAGYWAPVLWLSYLVDTAVFGMAPFGYRLVNILLHAVNAAMLLVLLRSARVHWGPALAVSALFAWHPLRVESVVWITERKDVLSGFFFLASIGAYARSKSTSGLMWERLGPMFALLGLMVKPMLVTLPAVLLLLDFWPLKRIQLNRLSFPTVWPLVSEKALYWVMVPIFSLLTILTQKGEGALAAASHVSLQERILGVVPAYRFYLQKFVWPLELSPLYPDVDIHLSSILGGLLILIILSILAVLLVHSRPMVLVGWLLFLGMLVPVIGLFRAGTVHVADRFMYLPSIGLGLMLVGIWQRKRTPLFMSVYSATWIAVLIACVSLTRSYMPVWTDGTTLFRHALPHVPTSPLAHNNYGEALLNQGEIDLSLKHFMRAAKLSPDTAPFTANVGLALLLLGNSEEAIRTLRDSLDDHDPQSPHLNFMMGLALLDEGRPQNAISHIHLALEKVPRHPIWRLELARAYLQSGQSEGAQQQFRILEDLGYPQLASLEGISVVYAQLWERHQGRRAWIFFEWLIRAQPKNIALLNNVAWLLATIPPADVSPAKAIELATRANDLTQGTNPNILNTLSVAHAAAHEFYEAILYAEQASALAQRHGMTNLATRIDQRIALFQKEQQEQGPPVD